MTTQPTNPTVTSGSASEVSPQKCPRSLALVGAGYWGKNLARNFNDLGALRTICDASEQALRSYEAGFEGVSRCADLEQVLKDPGVSKVAIAAPAAQHYELAKAALVAGKDVFVEKPLCLEVENAAELIEIAKSGSRVLMVGHLLQYHPCILKLQALLGQGELGKLHYITSNRLNLGKIRREENALWSFAPHDLSVILSLAGNRLPEQVRCTGESYLTNGVADTTLTSLRFGGGVRAHVFVTWLNPFKEQKLTVVGSNGMIVFDDTRPWNEKLVLYRQYLTWTNGTIPTPNKAKGEPVVIPESEPLKNECQHFLKCCEERHTPRTDGEEGLRVLRVLQAAQHSLERDGEAIRIGDRLQSPDVPPPVVSGSVRPPVAPVSCGASSATPPSSDFFAHPTAVIDDGAIIGKGSKIWHFSHVMKGARIGERCILGQNVNVDGGTVLGTNVKIQNNVSIYTGAVIEDDVFLGPSCVLTNVTNPRSQVNRHSLYEKTVIRRGATIGANATIVCGVTIGRYAFVAAGAVVTKNVPDYALILGNPGRQKGWMSRHGHWLGNPSADGVMTCPESGLRYQLVAPTADGGPPSTGQQLRCLDLDENAPLPESMTKGKQTYDEFKGLSPSRVSAAGEGQPGSL